MIEAVLSVLIVGLMLVASLTTLGAVGTSRVALVDQERGTALAESMLAEIVDLPYADPLLPLLFGPEPGEANGGNPSRAAFDDVDDYNGWVETPPRKRDGVALPNLGVWTRETSVVWVNPDNLSQTRLTDEGAKRITVTVKRGQKVAATLTAIRTNGRP